MRILAIGAHPDDIEYGCCGFLLRMKQEGHEVCLLVLSGGEKGISGPSQDRILEQRKAFEMCDFSRLYLKHFPDGDIVCNNRLVSEIESVIRETAPELILVNHPNDYHQDHSSVARAVIAAARAERGLLFYQAYSAIDFQPDIYVRIGTFVPKKIEVLQCFRSQIEKNIGKRIDFVESSISANRYYGSRIAAEYAEGLCLYRYIL